MDTDNASSVVSTISSVPAGLLTTRPPTNAAIEGRGPEREGWESFPWHYFAGYTINENSKRIGWTWNYGFDIRSASGTSHWVCKPCIRMRRRPISLAAAGTANQAHHLVKEHSIADPTGKRSAKPARISIATRLQLDPKKSEEQALLNKLICSFNPAYFQQLLVDWIAHDNIPFRKVESEPFCRLIEYLNPAVSQAGCLPTHKTIRKWLIDEFNRHKGIVSELLQGSPGLIHLSLDGWTSRNNKSLLGVIVHFLTSTGKLRQFTLGLPELDGHSGCDLAGQVAQVLAEWGLTNKIGYFVMDNASNNDSCLKDLAEEFGFDVKRRRLRCTGHIINLVIRQILFGDDADLFEAECSHPHELLAEHVLWRKKGPLGKLHNIVHWIYRSLKLRKKLRKLQADDPDNTSIYEVILDNATRWNSTDAMLERALKLQRYIDTLVLAEVLEWESYTRKLTQQGRRPRRKKPAIVDDYLTTEDWATLSEYHSILQPFKDVTMRLQGNPTDGEFGALWEVLPAIEFLLNHLEEVKDRDDVYSEEHFKVNVSLGWAKLNEYYTLLDETPAYTAAIVLHPGFRWAWIESTWAERQDWISDARARVRNLWDSEYKTQPLSAEEAIDPPPPKRRRGGESSSSFASWLQSSRTPSKAPAATEVDEYTTWQNEASPLDSEHENPIQYWLLRQKQYPRLSRMALDLFSIPAMSTEVERVFSLAGQMVTPVRNRLEGNTIAVAQVLRSWVASGVIKR